MHILYISALCTKRAYEQWFAGSSVKPSQAAQKYHRLMVEGLAKSQQCVVTVISALPVTSAIARKRLFHMEKEIYEGVEYIYLPFINLPLLRQCSLFISSLLLVWQMARKRRDSVAICDILNVSVAQGAMWGTRFAHSKNMGIVTDIPTLLINNDRRQQVIKAAFGKCISKIGNATISAFDSFLFLTTQMNERLNKHHRPCLVIEGQVDIAMQMVENSLENKYPQQVVLYAGSLAKRYGLPMLVAAFLQAAVPDAEMHLYGDGDYSRELSVICAANPQIRYFGIMDNARVVAEQLKATLLINPRPSHEEFTCYSFPSKNMEYMVSGSPLLTTKLAGMPVEYDDYVYLIEDETVAGLSAILTSLLAKSREELHAKGFRAKEFVLREKNNVAQAQKVLLLLERFTHA